MKLFISWSKARSNQVALLLREWLPSVVQRIEPWMSGEDIDKGQRWGIELSELLASTSQGIICVTADNVAEPWLNFEAGALAKSVTVARVRPVLLDLAPADVTGPLAQFQATTLTDRADMLRLVASLNAGTDKPVDPALLARSFDRAWDELAAAVDRLAALPVPGGVKPLRRTEEKIDEILGLVRELERGRPAVAGQAMAGAGDMMVDFSEVHPSLGVGRYAVDAFDTVGAFLNALYFQISPYVEPFTFGADWELYDVRRNVVLRELGSGWSRGRGGAPDIRSLSDVGLRGGAVLAARLTATGGDGGVPGPGR